MSNVIYENRDGIRTYVRLLDEADSEAYAWPHQYPYANSVERIECTEHDNGNTFIKIFDDGESEATFSGDDIDNLIEALLSIKAEARL